MIWWEVYSFNSLRHGTKSTPWIPCTRGKSWMWLRGEYRGAQVGRLLPFFFSFFYFEINFCIRPSMWLIDLRNIQVEILFVLEYLRFVNCWTMWAREKAASTPPALFGHIYSGKALLLYCQHMGIESFRCKATLWNLIVWQKNPSLLIKEQP